jgi:hypothetical protein
MKEWSDRELVKTSGFKKFNADSFEVFKHLFPDLYTEKEIKPGFFYKTIWKDSTRKEKSLFNKLGTNYSAYGKMINLTISEILDKNNIEANPSTDEGYTMIIEYLKNNKNFFKSILLDLGKIIERTSSYGDKYEDKSMKMIKDYFGDCKIDKTSGLGVYSDTIGGIDITVTKDGKSNNIQVKGVKSIHYNNNTYYIEYLNPKLYRVDYLLFSNKGNYYLFKNQNVEIEVSDRFIGYKIPHGSKVSAQKY